jgi:hypothetical protein
VELVAPLVLSVSGVVIAAVAYVNRDRPDWEPRIRATYALAIGQVILGVVVWLLLRTGRP